MKKFIVKYKNSPYYLYNVNFKVPCPQLANKYQNKNRLKSFLREKGISKEECEILELDREEFSEYEIFRECREY